MFILLPSVCKIVPVSCVLVDGDVDGDLLEDANPWLEPGPVLGNPGSDDGVHCLPAANPRLSSCLSVLHIVGPKFSIKTLFDRVWAHNS